MTVSFHTDDLTPIEYLAVGSRERIHTEMLRWLVGEESPLPGHGVGLLETLWRAAELGGNCPFADAPKCVSRTEVEGIDLVIQTGTHVIAIENKLKSSEHSNQLRKYDDVLLRRYGDGRALDEFTSRFFLTLVGDERRSSSGWQPVTYHTLLGALRVAAPHDGRHGRFVAEYIEMLERLVEATRRVTEQPDEYAGDGVLFDTTTRGSAPDDKADFNAYVERLRLKMILQKAWMLKLALRTRERLPLNGDSWSVGENRGKAHLSWRVGILRAQHSGTAPCASYEVGVQLQHNRFKAFCAPFPYGNKVKPEDSTFIEGVLAAFSAQLSSSTPDGWTIGKTTRPQRLGFSSIGMRCAHVENTRDIDAWATALASAVDTVRAAANTIPGGGGVAFEVLPAAA